MSRPVLEVELDGQGSLVRGYGSRDLYERVVGRPPVYIPRLRGWSCQERTARNIVALAESLGYDVVITGGRSRKQQLLDVLMAAPPPRPIEHDEAKLW